jgi:hypothetical protein
MRGRSVLLAMGLLATSASVAAGAIVSVNADRGSAVLRATAGTQAWSLRVLPRGRVRLFATDAASWRPQCLRRPPAHRRCIRAMPGGGWAILRPVKFIYTGSSPFKLVVQSTGGFNLSVNGTGSLNLQGTGSYLLSGNTYLYNGFVHLKLGP